MDNKENIAAQNEQLEEMNYTPAEDIFAQEERIPLDNNGNPISEKELEELETDDLDMDLDIPGAGADDDMQAIGEEDEENNYWSLSDNLEENESSGEDLV